MIQAQEIKLSKLHPNKGQIQGVPTNPRRATKEANERNLKATKRELPKYSYDGHIVMTPFFSQLSRYGIEFSLPVDESEPISQLDSQKEAGKAIFGKGYIMSERMFQLREKAERWKLSEREIKIIAKLSMKK